MTFWRLPGFNIEFPIFFHGDDRRRESIPVTSVAVSLSIHRPFALCPSGLQAKLYPPPITGGTKTQPLGWTQWCIFPAGRRNSDHLWSWKNSLLGHFFLPRVRTRRNMNLLGKFVFRDWVGGSSFVGSGQIYRENAGTLVSEILNL